MSASWLAAPLSLSRPIADGAEIQLALEPELSPSLETPTVEWGNSDRVHSDMAISSPTNKVIAPSTSGSDARTTVEGDRLWLISTRHLSRPACSAVLDPPRLKVWQLDSCGRMFPSALETYLSQRRPDRTTVMYVHGNRMNTTHDAIRRSLNVHRATKRSRTCVGGTSIDWVVWSWPSEKQGLLLGDVRVKASRADTQGLYLAWLLREQINLGQPTSMIGYSFGARVVTGALHALAGGSLGRRVLPGESVAGANIPIGLVAPAIDRNWLATGGYHDRATRNLNSVGLLYNRRDMVLKNYWRLDRIRNADALGYSGPRNFAPRFDGTRLPVVSRDCAPIVGRRHDEMDYYASRCGGGRMMAEVIAKPLRIHP